MEKTNESVVPVYMALGGYNKKAVLSQGNGAMPQLFFPV